uniref:PARP catalytic domain-containing protein n=1 Tax=Alexandrium catenella TaxID=2925 RepID=A0A7S1RZ29_ALECA|eukprot:CAMPEP_0171219906 /NCGR_PEP_ID=MMETSP0790-20130122/33960_1 /TAXON_ID=2925 /ORGANISM="Alexandrium catenella, Strain OF101" /LENGTH=201 /DNA_ID=CAMNT_0011685777 /DNA_START=72 /DNA_END=677 /DNA_ORIENTATION=-
MGKHSDAGEKKAYGIIKHIPVIGNLYSAGRAVAYLAKGQKCEAARSAAGIVLASPLLMAGDEIAKAIQRDNSGRYVGKKTLYHITNRKAGAAIRSSKTMRCGVDGVLGRGVYFAEDRQACRRKAVHLDGKGACMITARVDLGKCLFEDTGGAYWRMLMDGGHGGKKLANSGISSVGCNHNGGMEYCVFDPKRIKILSVEEV